MKLSTKLHLTLGLVLISISWLTGDIVREVTKIKNAVNRNKEMVKQNDVILHKQDEIILKYREHKIQLNAEIMKKYACNSFGHFSVVLPNNTMIEYRIDPVTGKAFEVSRIQY